MIEFTVDWRKVRAAACAVVKRETRYYLNGVCMEYRLNGPIFVATDGYRLIAARQDWTEGVEPPENFDSVIVPIELVKRVKIGKSDTGMVTLKIDALKIISVTNERGDTFTEPAIDGTFPDWRTVALPKEKASGAPAQYNADYLASFQAAMRELGIAGKGYVPRIAHNGLNPTLVDMYTDDAFGVIMGVRGEPGRQEPPDWAKV